MPELFPISEVTQKSPRLLWLEEHDFHTKFRRDLHSSDLNRWEAYTGEHYDAWEKTYMSGFVDPLRSRHLAIGITESEALRNLCDNRGIDMI